MEKVELSTEDMRDAILLWVKTKHPELIERAMSLNDSDVKWLWQIQLKPLAATVTIFKDKEEFDKLRAQGIVTELPIWLQWLLFSSCVVLVIAMIVGLLQIIFTVIGK